MTLANTLGLLGLNFPMYKIGERRRRKQQWVIANIYLPFSMFQSSFLRTFHITTHLIITKIIREKYYFYLTIGKTDIVKLAPVTQEVCVLVGVLAVKLLASCYMEIWDKWQLIYSFCSLELTGLGCGTFCLKFFGLLKQSRNLLDLKTSGISFYFFLTYVILPLSQHHCSAFCSM